jgi:hypothetical protein
LKQIFFNIFILLLSVNTFASEQTSYSQSLDIWKTYYPNHNCIFKNCARNVPPEALSALLEKGTYYHPEKLSEKKWMMVVDFNQHSKEKRGYLIKTSNGAVTQFHIAHGENSGDGEGNVIKLSNIEGSHMSSKGLYVTAETYSGSFGYSLRIDGLESTNSNARERAIVIHGYKGMTEKYIKENGKARTSWGCPAISKELSKSLIDKIKNGTLYYIHSDL